MGGQAITELNRLRGRDGLANQPLTSPEYFGKPQRDAPWRRPAEVLASDTRLDWPEPGPPTMAPPSPAPAQPPAPAPAQLPAPDPSRVDRSARRGLARRVPWPLLALLALQAWLSLRLVWSNAAFTDEAQYLWAGHAEWAHLLHGTPIPPFPTYFSGSPAIYPLIGALADSIGGLTAARLLSLAFMLAVTGLLWDAASRLYGRRAAFFGAALFAVLGPTLRLGAFATYDAMALLLLVAAAWCLVRGAGRQDATGWAAAAGFLLVASNVTKYATAIFVPVIIALSFLLTRLYQDRKVARMRVVTVFLCWVSGAIGCWEAATIGNGYYATGIKSTTLDRAISNATVAAVLRDSWSWVGLVAALAVAGAALAWSVNRRYAPLLTVLAAAALLVPLEQARIHTLTSLNKHVDFGAWFAAIAAGYAISWLIKLTRFSRVQAAATIGTAVLLLYPLQLGVAQAKDFFSWPNATVMMTALGKDLRGVNGNVLIDSHPIAQYYLNPPSSEWERWSSTTSLVLPSGQTVSAPPGSRGTSLYESFIRRGYFKVIELNTFNQLGGKLTAFLKKDRSYVVAAAVRAGPDRFIIWNYEPAKGNR